MKNFEDRSDGGMCITEGQIHIRLAFHEAYSLWQWLSARQDLFHAHSSENPLEIPANQEDLSHGEDVQTAIADLHEREPIDKVFDARREITTEQALPLLKPSQIENHLHPFLEDDYTYAQG